MIFFCEMLPLNRFQLCVKSQIGLRPFQSLTKLKAYSPASHGCVKTGQFVNLVPRFPLLTALNPRMNLLHYNQNILVSPVKMALRNFHSTPRNMVLGGRDPFRKSPFNNPRFIFSISPFSFILSTLLFAGFITMIVFVLPFLLALLFPMVIFGIGWYQFKAFRTRKLMQLLDHAFNQTKMKLSSTTRRELIMKQMVPKFKSFTQLKDFSGFPFKVSQAFTDKFQSGEFPNADRFLSFVKSRLDESFYKNEHNIKSIVLGSDTAYVPGHMELVTNSYSFVSSVRNNENIQAFSFMLLNMGSEGVRKPVALVYIVTKANPGDELLMFTGDYIDDSKLSPMVIYVRALSPFSKCCFITDVGETGANAQYSVKRKKDGSKEYTYESD